jgi:L-gulonate 3-dehydrogenase
MSRKNRQKNAGSGEQYMKNVLQTAAVVGAGLVGSSWAIVFARAGLGVKVFDARPEVRESVQARIRLSLADLQKFGLIEDADAVAARITIVDRLADAVGDADYVQESVFERVDVKQTASREIGVLIRDEAVVGSSSSGIPASAFTADATRRSRFLVVHPVNPPHLIPLVELVPAPWTDVEIIPWLCAAMERVGQTPIVVNREIEGFVLNRLQGALLNEAFALFDAGIASAADIDRTVADGLGLRWSFMGPFETIDLNATGGVDDYAQRLGALYHSVALDRRNPQPWSRELIARLDAERRAALPHAALDERAAWRDRRLMALAVHQRDQTER